MKNISTYGAKALFYINVNNEPPFKLLETLEEGSSLSDPVYTNEFKIPGEYTITGKLYLNSTFQLLLTCTFS